MKRSSFVLVATVFISLTYRTQVISIGFGTEMVCGHMHGLTPRQRDVCRAVPEAMAAVAQGIHLGLTECRHQFLSHRWNCTSLNKKYPLGYVITIGSREAAFTYSIVSAAVAYSVAAACSRGNLSHCGCEKGEAAHSAWKWGGCSVDISYGMKLSRRFLDARELEQDGRSHMNLHNNKVGRVAVRHNLERDCKCHGVSGSCTMKTCWKALPQFRQIGDHLKRKYYKARPIRWVVGSGMRTKKTKRKPRTSDLVFLDQSPNYCEADPETESLGTRGRQCNKTSSGISSCSVLCCGRGYNTHRQQRMWQCECKFYWCCYVKCKTCREQTEIHTCK